MQEKIGLKRASPTAARLDDQGEVISASAREGDDRASCSSAPKREGDDKASYEETITLFDFRI